MTLRTIRVLLCLLALLAAPARAQTMAPHPAMDMEAPWNASAEIERLEGQVGAGRATVRLDGHAWIGTDEDRLWFKTDSRLGPSGAIEGRQELLWGHAASTFFDVLGGAHVDISRDVTRTWLAFGAQGMALHFIDVEAFAYAGDRGRFAGRLRLATDLAFTQDLVLQPFVEANAYSRSDLAGGTAAGLSDLEAGLLLRYEVTRGFAPYIGLAYEARYGDAARSARAEGEQAQRLRLLFGLRLAF